MIPFSIGDQKIQLPASWDDVTTGQMIEIKTMPTDDFFRLLEILSGVKKKTWYDCEMSLLDIELLTTTINFLKTPPDFRNLPMPPALDFGGKLLTIPQDLNLKTFGQLTTYGILVTPTVVKTGDVIEALDIALAIYLQPLFTGEKFNGDDLAPYIAMARATRVTEAYPVAAFFLNRPTPSSPAKTRSSATSKSKTPKRKSTPASKRLTNTES